MPTNRIHQLNQTIYELRLRGLSERQETRELRQANKELKTQLEAAQREIEALRSDNAVSEVEVICFDARHYEALSVQRAEGKPCRR